MTSPPDPTPIGVCIDDLARVLSDRPCVPADRRDAHAGAVKRLINAFEPRDAVQLIAAGQAVLFNALIVDGAGDILRDEEAPARPRARDRTWSRWAGFWRSTWTR